MDGWCCGSNRFKFTLMLNGQVDVLQQNDRNMKLLSCWDIFLVNTVKWCGSERLASLLNGPVNVLHLPRPTAQRNSDMTLPSWGDTLLSPIQWCGSDCFVVLLDGWVNILLPNHSKRHKYEFPKLVSHNGRSALSNEWKWVLHDVVRWPAQYAWPPQTVQNAKDTNFLSWWGVLIVVEHCQREWKQLMLLLDGWVNILHLPKPFKTTPIWMSQITEAWWWVSIVEQRGSHCLQPHPVVGWTCQCSSPPQTV